MPVSIPISPKSVYAAHKPGGMAAGGGGSWREGRDAPCPAASLCPLQGPAYNRHTLPGDSEPTEQAKEILILRHKSLLVEVSGSDTCSSRKEVRGNGHR